MIVKTIMVKKNSIKELVSKDVSNDSTLSQHWQFNEIGV